MRIVNSLVSMVLRSPAHRILSRSVDLIRYAGATSGLVFTTPTQYVEHDGEVVILVGKPATKTWWKNFRGERDLDVLINRQWRPMRGRAVIGADEPDEATPLVDAYLTRFPNASRALGSGTRAEQVRQAVVVRCRAR